MKKRNILGVFLLIISLVFFGNLNANADGFNAYTKCPEEVTRGEIFSCEVYANYIPESPVVKVSGAVVKNEIFMFDHFEKSNYISNAKETYYGGFEYTSTSGVPKDRAIFKVYLKVDGKSTHSNERVNITLSNVEMKSGDKITNFEIESEDIKFLASPNPRSFENRLSSLEFSSGTLSQTFDSDLLEYTLITDEEELTVNAVAKSTLAKVQINGKEDNKIKLEPGENTLTITVTAEDESVKTYKILVLCNDNRNDDASLQLLSVDGEKILLKNDKYDYEISVPFETEKANLLYAASSTTSNVEVEGSEDLQVGENKFVLTVTSEKGTTQKYNLIIKRSEEVKSGNSSLKKIEITNVDDLDFEFKSDNHNYMIKLPKDVDKLNFNIELGDPKSTYEITGNEDLVDYSKVLITVTAEDGSTTTYTFLIEKDGSSNLMLVIIIVVIVLVLTAAIVFVFIKKKKNNKNDKNNNDSTGSSNELKESNDNKVVDEFISSLDEESKEDEEEVDNSAAIDEFIDALNEEPNEDEVDNSAAVDEFIDALNEEYDEEYDNDEVIDEFINALNTEFDDEYDNDEAIDEFINALNEDIDVNEDTKEFIIDRKYGLSNPEFEEDKIELRNPDFEENDTDDKENPDYE